MDDAPRGADLAFVYTAERALRTSVILRRLSFGTESRTGSRTRTVSLSAVETCRRLGGHALSDLHSAPQAYFAHRPAPKLLASA